MIAGSFLLHMVFLLSGAAPLQTDLPPFEDGGFVLYKKVLKDYYQVTESRVFGSGSVGRGRTWLVPQSRGFKHKVALRINLLPDSPDVVSVEDLSAPPFSRQAFQQALSASKRCLAEGPLKKRLESLVESVPEAAEPGSPYEADPAQVEALVSSLNACFARRGVDPSRVDTVVFTNVEERRWH